MPEIVILAKDGSIHHARPLLDYFSESAIVERDWSPDAILRHNAEIIITFDEHGAELGLCVSAAIKQGVASLLLRDGILEWRMVWENETSESKRPVNQPILSHKVACLGNADARITESWGNVGTCEIVGSPRFDDLVKLNLPMRTSPIKSRPMRLLVMTAKTPGFNQKQIEATFNSLADLKNILQKRSDIEVVWRITQNLHDRLGVTNTINNLLSNELHDILQKVDAVITTPSTTLLESMLCGLPVALLDYHNCPHYVPSAWRITCREQIEPVLEELKSAPLPKMLYQDYCLHDALSCRKPSFPRMVSLIEEMIRIRREQKALGKSQLKFPHRILDNPEEHISWPSDSFDLESLYPNHRVFGNRNLTIMQAELESAIGVISNLQKQNEILISRLYRIPGYKLAAKIARKLKS